MNRRGHAGRVDANHVAITEALNRAGATVQSLGIVGCGCPDLLVGIRGQTYLIEVKNPAAPKAHRDLTDAQKKWHVWWRGAKVHTVETAEQALALIL